MSASASASVNTEAAKKKGKRCCVCAKELSGGCPKGHCEDIDVAKFQGWWITGTGDYYCGVCAVRAGSNGPWDNMYDYSMSKKERKANVVKTWLQVQETLVKKLWCDTCIASCDKRRNDDMDAIAAMSSLSQLRLKGKGDKGKGDVLRIEDDKGKGDKGKGDKGKGEADAGDQGEAGGKGEADAGGKGKAGARAIMMLHGSMRRRELTSHSEEDIQVALGALPPGLAQEPVNDAGAGAIKMLHSSLVKRGLTSLSEEDIEGALTTSSRLSPSTTSSTYNVVNSAAPGEYVI